METKSSKQNRNLYLRWNYLVFDEGTTEIEEGDDEGMKVPSFKTLSSSSLGLLLIRLREGDRSVVVVGSRGFLAPNERSTGKRSASIVVLMCLRKYLKEQTENPCFVDDCKSSCFFFFFFFFSTFFSTSNVSHFSMIIDKSGACMYEERDKACRIDYEKDMSQN